jgi:capsular polysaccharide biosynthesis protein
LTGVSAGEFGHWMLEHLPKIKLFETFSKYDNYPIYVNSSMHKSHYEALELLLLRKREIVVIESGTSVFFERLLVAPTFTFFPYVSKPYLQITADFNACSTEAVRFLRERFLSKLNLSGEASTNKIRGRRIFLARKPGGRNVINQSEIQDYLVSFGFEVIYPEKLTFAQQIRLFNESDCVFGPNSSAFINTIFCRKGSIIVPFWQTYGTNVASWANVIEELGLKHLIIAGTAMPGSSWHQHHFDYTIPIPLIKLALQQLEIEPLD